jgi:hypothetical protein
MFRNTVDRITSSSSLQASADTCAVKVKIFLVKIFLLYTSNSSLHASADTCAHTRVPQLVVSHSTCQKRPIRDKRDLQVYKLMSKETYKRLIDL